MLIKCDECGKMYEEKFIIILEHKVCNFINHNSLHASYFLCSVCVEKRCEKFWSILKQECIMN